MAGNKKLINSGNNSNCLACLKRHKLAGFTLVELLVVLVIVGILAVAAYPSYRQHILKGEWLKTKSVLFGLAGDLEAFYLKTRSYQSAPWQQWLVQYGKIASYQISVDLQADSYKIMARPTDRAIGAGLVLQQDGRQSCLPKQVTDCWENYR